MSALTGSIRPVDFITRKLSAPMKMEPDDLADLFDAINELVAPLLPQLGMQPLGEIKDRVGGWGLPGVVEAQLNNTRLILAHQTEVGKDFIYRQSVYEIYLTEQGEWLVVSTRASDADGVRIIRSRQDLRSYIIGIEENYQLGYHPGQWLLKSARAIIDRAVADAEQRLEPLRTTKGQLDDWGDQLRAIYESDDR